MSTRLDVDNEKQHDKMNGNDSILTNEISEIDDMSFVLSQSESQQSWFQSIQDTWSLSFPATGFMHHCRPIRILILLDSGP